MFCMRLFACLRSRYFFVYKGYFKSVGLDVDIVAVAQAGAEQAADMRHSQVRSLDRSERIRTYNFPENRIVQYSYFALNA